MSDPSESLSPGQRREVRALAEGAAKEVVGRLRGASGREGGDGGVSRRDALKVGGLSGLIGAAVLGGRAAGEPPGNGNGDNGNGGDDGNGGTPNPNLRNLNAGEWNLAKDTVTRPVSPQYGTGGPATTYEKRIYCFGLDHRANVALDIPGGDPATIGNEGRQLLAYDTKRNEWSSLTPPPEDAIGGGATTDASRDTLYLLNSTGFYAYDVSADDWDTPDDPGAIGDSPGLAFVDGAVYQVDRTGVRSYTPADGWEDEGDLPTPRDGVAAVGHGGYVYAIGGGERGQRRTVERYDASAGSWETLGDLPFPAHNHAATAVDGRIYVVNGSGVSTATMVFETGAERWDWYPSPYTEPPTYPAVGASGAPDTPDALFVFGGIDAHEPFRADAFGLPGSSGGGNDDEDDGD